MGQRRRRHLVPPGARLRHHRRLPAYPTPFSRKTHPWPLRQHVLVDGEQPEAALERLRAVRTVA